MDREAKKALLDCTLERAADQLGDITPDVTALYYARLPDARAQFVHHEGLAPERLEGEMVEQTVFCLMEWLDSPSSVEIILVTTVPHHMEILGVGMTEFAELLRAVCDVLATTIPADREDERALLLSIHEDLQSVIAEAATSARPMPAKVA